MSLVAVFALLAADPQAATAQAAPAAPAAQAKAAPDTAVSGVTVTGGGQAVRTEIDRKSYDVTKDLNATSGSLADALRNLPVVDVSPQGDVSMRGSAVTILVDGKVSAAFRGPNAGLALQSLPASQIERVEVITNPSAEFTPEGGGGVINLITRKTQTPGLSGAARLNVADGHENGGVSVNWKAGKLSLNAGVSVRHDQQRLDSRSAEQFFTAAGAPQETALERGAYSNHSDSLSYNLNGDYDLNAKTRLSGGYYHGAAQSGGPGAFDRLELNPDGSQLDHLARSTLSKFGYAYDDVDFTLRRQLPGESGHQLTLSLDYDILASPNRRTFDEVQFPSLAPDDFVDTPTRTRQAQTQVDLKYDRPMPGKAMLKLGYSLRQTDTGSRSDGVAGPSPATAAPDPGQIDAFTFGQTIHALDGTYQLPIGKKLTVMPGLRVEDAVQDLHDTVTATRVSTNDVSVYPSFHLDYALTDIQSLNFSYSHRIVRPGPNDLNPFLQILDPDHLRQGDPRLHPQDTDSFEGGWERRKDGAVLTATLFRRDTTGGLADAVSDLGGGVLLTTRANIGQGQSTGLELAASGKLFKALSYTVSVNAAYVDLYTPGVGLGSDGREHGVTAGGKATLAWQPTAKDFLQANLVMNPEAIDPQGYTNPYVQLNLGFRHKFDDAWALNVTASDAADSVRFATAIDAPELRRRSAADYNGRAVFVGFTYSFGQGAPRAQTFDFGGGGAAPGG